MATPRDGRSSSQSSVKAQSEASTNRDKILADRQPSTYIEMIKRTLALVFKNQDVLSTRDRDHAGRARDPDLRW
jgi:hypothetical protein